MPVEQEARITLVSIGAQLGSCQIRLDGITKAWRPDLNLAPCPAAHLECKSQRRLTRGRRRDYRVAPDQHAPGLTANILLEVPSLRLLADEEHEALDLGIPELLGSGFRCWQLLGKGFCELWHTVGFLSVLRGNYRNQLDTM